MVFGYNVQGLGTMYRVFGTMYRVWVQCTGFGYNV